MTASVLRSKYIKNIKNKKVKERNLLWQNSNFWNILQAENAWNRYALTKHYIQTFSV